MKDANDVSRKTKGEGRKEKTRQTRRMEDKWAKRGDDVRKEGKLRGSKRVHLPRAHGNV